MIRKNKQFKGGLQDVADDLGVRDQQAAYFTSIDAPMPQVMRIGLPHQAGSD